MLNALSFDVEEWYHAELVRKSVPAEQRASQVEQASQPILALLARRGLRATFFLTGEVVRDHPALVQAVRAGDHEIGCHTMSHRPLWEMTPETLRAELREFRSVLAGATGPQTSEVSADLGGLGAKVIGFRAPTFSLNQKTSWALDVLAAEGFLYDSSIFPAANPVYGLDGGPLAAYRPSAADLRQNDERGRIVELPMTVWEVVGRRVPVSGGFYLRALPQSLLLHALRQVSRTRPVVLYMHPWEAYAATPSVSVGPLGRFITHYGRASALPKLERILDMLEFAPLRDVLQPLWSATTPVVRTADSSRRQESSHSRAEREA